MVRCPLPIPTPAPETLTVEGERFHYLIHVLRRRVGDALEVFDGQGRAFAATVEGVEAERAVLRLGAAIAAAGSSGVTLIQGLPKGEKLEWILQKGTELGAAAFALAATARSVVKVREDREEAKLERWRRIAEEAARQCGRADVPEVRAPRALLDAVAALPAGTRVLVLDTTERAVSLAEGFARCGGGSALALVIGPEGGLERAEVEALVARGAVPVTMGQRILRTETASLAALAVLSHLQGQL